ncbi:MAG: phytanoyl-CoA dioxygenase family protein [Tepidisphaeraceae bacterium]
MTEHSITPVPTSFTTDGYAVVPAVLSDAQTAATREAADLLYRSSGRPRAGVREPVLHSPVLRGTAALPAVMRIARDVLGVKARVVRSILFDKTPDANWDVVWHQDVTIAVREKVETPGFGPWSSKAGVPSVQPPAAVLERMLTIRIHLDDCPADNGPLLVVPGSHNGGVMAIETLDTAACDANAVACTLTAGSAVLMRPLLLHASRKSAAPAHRRVLHLDFAADPLPSPLRWYGEE